MSASSTERLAEAFAALPALAGLPDHRAFELLAAMVVHRWLDERTVHDVTMRGASLAPHQIDVLVGDDSQRALIECKYLTRKVDMPLARNFYGAVEDLGCDLAAIVTTMGFSENVKRYAAAKSIDLLLLRDTEKDDLAGRITSVRLEVSMFHVELMSCRVQESANGGPANDRSACIDLSDASVVIEHASGRLVPFAERYREHHSSFTLDREDGVYPVADVFVGPTWLKLNAERLAIERIDWEFVVSRSTHTSLLKHKPLVSLVSHDGDVLQVMSEQQLSAVELGRSTESAEAPCPGPSRLSVAAAAEADLHRAS